MSKESFAAIIAKEGIMPPLSDSNSATAAVAVRKTATGAMRGAVLSPDGGGEEERFSRMMQYAADGVDSRRLRDLLRRRAEAELDLHGMTAAEAHLALDEFLRVQMAGGRRRLEIVHGRGGHSKDGRAVLRGKTRMWLAHCGAVLAFVEPPKNPGAVRVLLRRGAG